MLTNVYMCEWVTMMTVAHSRDQVDDGLRFGFDVVNCHVHMNQHRWLPRVGMILFSDSFFYSYSEDNSNCGSIFTWVGRDSIKNKSHSYNHFMRRGKKYFIPTSLVTVYKHVNTYLLWHSLTHSMMGYTTENSPYCCLYRFRYMTSIWERVFLKHF